MKLKTSKRTEHPFLSSARSPPKVIAPIQISPNESIKKSNTSTHLSERSNSTKRVFIPKSHKLDQFFHQSPHFSSRQGFSSPTQHYLNNPQKVLNQLPKPKAERLEFLKFNLNKDYFDDELDHGLYQPTGNQLDKINRHDNSPKWNYSRQNKMSDKNWRTPGRQQSVPKIIRLKSEGEITSHRIKIPKVLVPAVDRLMSKSKKTLPKMASLKSLEYTFGLP